MNLEYRKQRKHTHKQTRKMIMRLLALLGKMLGEIADRCVSITPNRIVSLSKPHIRPIVIGKETRPQSLGRSTTTY